MATAFGVIAIVVSLFGAFLAGWIGVGVVVVLAGLAIFFRIRKNKLDAEAPKKKGAIVCGIIAIVIGLITQFGMSAYAGKLKEVADELGDVPYVSAAADGFKTLGFLGFMTKAMEHKPENMTDTQFGEELKNQLDKVSSKISSK